jgi:hypothetical protein
MKEINNNLKEKTNNRKTTTQTNTKLKKKGEVWISYGRVSSIQQVRDGNGLPCQKKRCIEYAKSKGYEIEQFFSDE